MLKTNRVVRSFVKISIRGTYDLIPGNMITKDIGITNSPSQFNNMLLKL